MVVLWGEQLIQIYNDAYCDIMSSKHPAGLGQPTEQCSAGSLAHQSAYLRGGFDRGTLTFEDSLYPSIAITI